MFTRLLPLAAMALGLGIAACGSTTKRATTSSHTPPAAAAFNRLPASDFPAMISRGQPQETGTLTFRLTLLGRQISLTASASSVAGREVGTLTRSRTDFALHFHGLRYRVAPVRLPNGLTIASQLITLSPRAPSTLLIDRRTGVDTSDLHWVVIAPNALYNGTDTINLQDKGSRRFLSFKQIGAGSFSFKVLSLWQGSVLLRRWSVAGKPLPGGHIAMSGSFSGHYVLDVKR